MASQRFSSSVVAVLLLALLGCLLQAPAAGAAPIGADGTISACYASKGKKKGTVRLVKAGKKCKKKRGEKPLVWGVRGPAGPQGLNGAIGPQGPAGAGGDSSELLELINAQALQLQALTDQLEGLTSELEAVTGVVSDVCDQLGAVTSNLNAVSDVVGGLGLNPVLDLLGGLIEVAPLPTDLDPLACTGLD